MQAVYTRDITDIWEYDGVCFVKLKDGCILKCDKETGTQNTKEYIEKCYSIAIIYLPVKSQKKCFNLFDIEKN